MLDDWMLIAFAVALALALIAVLIIFLYHKRNTKDAYGNNINEIIGAKCVVTERIDNFAGCGEARVNGLVWSARAAFEDEVFEEGEVLVIVAVEGVKLICKKEI